MTDNGRKSYITSLWLRKKAQKEQVILLILCSEPMRKVSHRNSDLSSSVRSCALGTSINLSAKKSNNEFTNVKNAKYLFNFIKIKFPLWRKPGESFLCERETRCFYVFQTQGHGTAMKEEVSGDPQGLAVQKDPAAGLDALEAARALLAHQHLPSRSGLPFELFMLSCTKCAASLSQAEHLAGHLKEERFEYTCRVSYPKSLVFKIFYILPASNFIPKVTVQSPGRYKIQQTCCINSYLHSSQFLWVYKMSISILY